MKKIFLGLFKVLQGLVIFIIIYTIFTICYTDYLYVKDIYTRQVFETLRERVVDFKLKTDKVPQNEDLKKIIFGGTIIVKNTKINSVKFLKLENINDKDILKKIRSIENGKILISCGVAKNIKTGKVKRDIYIIYNEKTGEIQFESGYLNLRGFEWDKWDL